ncbi:hypothetical protein [uncultured Nostoc sp.]|nr:hypothetical protein [uncultured Nostoc sp.]
MLVKSTLAEQRTVLYNISWETFDFKSEMLPILPATTSSDQDTPTHKN